ncbi:MAG: hypothetical protein RMJ60_03600 [Anaerolineales bacterium]|nr:hypothetical protein [Anaerolineales bacterium]
MWFALAGDIYAWVEGSGVAVAVLRVAEGGAGVVGRGGRWRGQVGGLAGGVFEDAAAGIRCKIGLQTAVEEERRSCIRREWERWVAVGVAGTSRVGVGVGGEVGIEVLVGAGAQ